MFVKIFLYFSDISIFLYSIITIIWIKVLLVLNLKPIVSIINVFVIKYRFWKIRATLDFYKLHYDEGRFFLQLQRREEQLRTQLVKITFNNSSGAAHKSIVTDVNSPFECSHPQFSGLKNYWGLPIVVFVGTLWSNGTWLHFPLEVTFLVWPDGYTGVHITLLLSWH